jgi:hypothetical protein
MKFSLAWVLLIVFFAVAIEAGPVADAAPEAGS